MTTQIEPAVEVQEEGMTPALAGHLLDIRIRGMLAEMFAQARVAPPAALLRKMQGEGTITMREIAETAHVLGFEVSFSFRDRAAPEDTAEDEDEEDRERDFQDALERLGKAAQETYEADDTRELGAAVSRGLLAVASALESL